MQIPEMQHRDAQRRHIVFITPTYTIISVSNESMPLAAPAHQMAMNSFTVNGQSDEQHHVRSLQVWGEPSAV